MASIGLFDGLITYDQNIPRGKIKYRTVLNLFLFLLTTIKQKIYYVSVNSKIDWCISGE